MIAKAMRRIIMMRLISNGVPSKNRAGSPTNSSSPGALKSPSPSAEGRMIATVARAKLDSRVSIIRASVRSKVEVIGVGAHGKHYQLDASDDESASAGGIGGLV